jgi:hypothetical protein
MRDRPYELIRFKDLVAAQLEPERNQLSNENLFRPPQLDVGPMRCIKGTSNNP